jgi:hypothetical protein
MSADQNCAQLTRAHGLLEVQTGGAINMSETSASKLLKAALEIFRIKKYATIGRLY